MCWGPSFRRGAKGKRRAANPQGRPGLETQVSRCNGHMILRARIDFTSSLRNRRGISTPGLIAFAVVLIIVFVIAFMLLRAGKRAAYEITAKHDLRLFADVEQAYFAENNQYIGNAGDVISNDPDTASTLSVPGFTPSEGVIITIISSDPFVASCTHKKAPAKFEYDFAQGTMKSR
jgi:hypothetical protein